MTILGVGIDIVRAQRIERVYRKYGDAFAARILSRSELREFETVTHRSAWLARHFAAKEAVAKALGTGFSAGVYLRRITIAHEPAGRPYVQLEGPIGERLHERGARFHLSIADEADVAIAYVVLEGPTNA